MQRSAKRQTLRMWIRARRFVMHNILHADDPPHPLALGIAIGLFVTFTPTIGLQMILVVFLAWLLKANKLVGIPIVWISNPATFVPIYFPCYVLGRRMLGAAPKSREWWGEFRCPPEGFLAKMDFFWSRIWEIVAPLSVGCLLAATFFGVVGYFLSYSVIYTYRMKRFGTVTPVEMPADDELSNEDSA